MMKKSYSLTDQWQPEEDENDPNDVNKPQSAARCKYLCKDLDSPICGTNMVEYRNECFFDCAKKEDRELDIIWFGKCEQRPPDPEGELDLRLIKDKIH